MNESQIREKVKKALEDARKLHPLVPSITNTVTVNFVANAQIASGGSAAMVYLPDEGEGLAQLGNSFYINMGTLLPVYEETVPRTAKKLFELKKNWVLDPVGLGIGSLRKKIMLQIKKTPPSIIRGNASEIIGVAELWGVTEKGNSNGVRGVDSADPVQSAFSAAKKLALFINGAVSVSGTEDFVTDGKTSILCQGGSHFMEKITGAGCSLGGVTAVFAGVAEPFTACAAATLLYDYAGKKAGESCKGPASFQTEFLDLIYSSSPSELSQNPFKIQED